MQVVISYSLAKSFLYSEAYVHLTFIRSLNPSRLPYRNSNTVETSLNYLVTLKEWKNHKKELNNKKMRSQQKKNWAQHAGRTPKHDIIIVTLYKPHVSNWRHWRRDRTIKKHIIQQKIRRGGGQGEATWGHNTNLENAASRLPEERWHEDAKTR